MLARLCLFCCRCVSIFVLQPNKNWSWLDRIKMNQARQALFYFCRRCLSACLLFCVIYSEPAKNQRWSWNEKNRNQNGNRWQLLLSGCSWRASSTAGLSPWTSSRRGSRTSCGACVGTGSTARSRSVSQSLLTHSRSASSARVHTLLIFKARDIGKSSRVSVFLVFIYLGHNMIYLANVKTIFKFYNSLGRFTYYRFSYSSYCMKTNFNWSCGSSAGLCLVIYWSIGIPGVHPRHCFLVAYFGAFRDVPNFWLINPIK